jgi:GH24 family phage-related lysozyme (muramidase)
MANRANFFKMLQSYQNGGIISHKDVPKYALYGDRAVKEVERQLGRPLSYAEKRVVQEEGFVPRKYYDSKGIVTYGVGQTGDYIEKGFPAAFKDHAERTKKYFKDFDYLPESVQAELIQTMYRGDVLNKKGEPWKWVNYFNKGDYKEAARELLDHKEYKKYKTRRDAGDSDAGGNIPERLEAARDAILTLINNKGV